eukprot:3921327-Prymnesium_polylepis.1
MHLPHDGADGQICLGGEKRRTVMTLPPALVYAARNAGDYVLSKCPRWLIFVEGVGYKPGAAGVNSLGIPGDNDKGGYWWGGNLVGVASAPVQLSDMTRLVYSPHVYGPGVYNQDYFKAADFPNNIEAVWESHFGFVEKATGQPIVVGEMGGWYTGDDKRWQVCAWRRGPAGQNGCVPTRDSKALIAPVRVQARLRRVLPPSACRLQHCRLQHCCAQDWAVPQMKANGWGLFYFALNPGSEDTG